MLHRLDIVVTEDDFELAQALVAQYAFEGWEEESLPTGETRIRVHAKECESLKNLHQEVCAMLPNAMGEQSELEEQNWTESWKEFFTPVEAGAFLITPPWLLASDQVEQGRAKGLNIIVIDPKSAFGTGHHATTTLCLDAISRLYAAGRIRPGHTFLDLGTGTGILGIGCVELGLSGLGVDIDPLAVVNAAENRALNQVGDAFQVQSGSVDAVRGQTYDLVIANILAAPLRDMAQEIMRLVKPGGCLVLSGFLSVQAAGLEESYAAMAREGKAGRLVAPSATSDPTRGTLAPDVAASVNATAAPCELDDWVCLFWPAL